MVGEHLLIIQFNCLELELVEPRPHCPTGSFLTFLSFNMEARLTSCSG